MKSEVIVEEIGGEPVKCCYISGPFIVAEDRNKNGRIYKSPVIEREVKLFTEEKINNNRAGGELNHPESPVVNLDRISHYITGFRREGNVWLGKAKIANTPMGTIAQTLIKDGYQLGVSTRGLGDVTDDGEVQENFKLVTVDLVSEPSAHSAFVEGVMENKNYIIKNGSIYEDAVNKLQKKVRKMPKSRRDEYVAEAVIAFIKDMNNE